MEIYLREKLFISWVRFQNLQNWNIEPLFTENLSGRKSIIPLVRSPKFQNCNIGPLFVRNLYGENNVPTGSLPKFSKMKYRTPIYWKFIWEKLFIPWVPSQNLQHWNIWPRFIGKLYGEKLCASGPPTQTFKIEIYDSIYWKFI